MCVCKHGHGWVSLRLCWGFYIAVMMHITVSTLRHNTSVCLPVLFDAHCSGSTPRVHTSTAAFLTQTVNLDDTTVKFEIWDTAGQERYHSLAPMYYRGAQAAVVVYDISDGVSYTPHTPVHKYHVALHPKILRKVWVTDTNSGKFHYTFKIVPHNIVDCKKSQWCCSGTNNQ